MTRREMSIRAALEWAFATEHASLDFDEALGDNARPGISTLWQIAQRGALGCSIDGGGRSLPADDADIIASAVSNLPVGLGGKGMALRIAALARARMQPDWMQDATPRCVPVGWAHENQHGRFALTAQCQSREGMWDYTARGRKVEVRAVACPVRFTPTAAQIASARRGWLDWYGALLWLQAELRGLGALDTIIITRAMPPLRPWALPDAESA